MPLIVLVILLLTVSIIGIPLLLLIPFVILAFLLSAFLGYLGAAAGLGRWLARRLGRSLASPFAALAVGLVAIHGWRLIQDVLDLLDGSTDITWPFGFMLWLFGVCLQTATWSVGLGAVLLAFRQRRLPPPVNAAPLPPLPEDDDPAEPWESDESADEIYSEAGEVDSGKDDEDMLSSEEDDAG